MNHLTGRFAGDLVSAARGRRSDRQRRASGRRRMGAPVRPVGMAPATGPGDARRSAAMHGRFDGKVVVITGAAGGIGRAAAVRFAGEGARVVLVDLATAPL